VLANVGKNYFWLFGRLKVPAIPILFLMVLSPPDSVFSLDWFGDPDIALRPRLLLFMFEF
jgi:hypothetical protein